MNSIGIDYHKRYSVVCAVDAEGHEREIVRIEHRFPEQFRHFVARQQPCQVAFESSMNWGWLCDLLKEQEEVKRIVIMQGVTLKIAR